MHGGAVSIVHFSSVIIFVAAYFAGIINAIAGGGTLLSFPALLWVGVNPIMPTPRTAPHCGRDRSPE